MQAAAASPSVLRKRGRDASTGSAIAGPSCWQPLSEDPDTADDRNAQKRRRTNTSDSSNGSLLGTRGVELVYNTASALLNTAAEAVVVRGLPRS